MAQIKSFDIASFDIAPFAVTIFIMCINVVMIGLFATFAYVVCSITPIVNVIHNINRHINRFDAITVAIGCMLFITVVYYTKNITDKIDKVFISMSQEIVTKDNIIIQLQNDLTFAINNATDHTLSNYANYVHNKTNLHPYNLKQ